MLSPHSHTGGDQSERDPVFLGDPPACMCAKSLQSCPTLFNPMDCSPPGSSVHVILQARILKWVAMPSSRESSQLWDQTIVSSINLHWQAGSLPLAPPGKPPKGFRNGSYVKSSQIPSFTEVHPRVIYFSSAERLHPVSSGPLDSLFCGSGEGTAHAPCRHLSLRMLKSKGKKELGVVARANGLWFQDGSQASVLITGFSVHLGCLSDLQAGVEPVHPDGDALCCHPEPHDAPFGCVSSSNWKISFLSLWLGLS